MLLQNMLFPMASGAPEALRLDPKNDSAHYNIGLALERKGDRPGALQEYRAACTLNPKDRGYQEHYERMLQQLNK